MRDADCVVARLNDWAAWRLRDGHDVGYSPMSSAANLSTVSASVQGTRVPRLFKPDDAERDLNRLIYALPDLEQTAILARFLLMIDRDQQRMLWAMANSAAAVDFESVLANAIDLLGESLRCGAT